jgi:hypothetical protein
MWSIDNADRDFIGVANINGVDSAHRDDDEY